MLTFFALLTASAAVYYWGVPVPIADLAKALDQKKKSLATAKQRKTKRAVAAKRA